MANCNCLCNLCPQLIISQSISVVSDTLVIDIPASTYINKGNYCIVISQLIPSTATVNQPVAISIGGDTTTLYPLVRCDGTQVTARQITDRIKLKVKVATSATTGVFRVLYGLIPCPNDTLASLPAPETSAPADDDTQTDTATDDAVVIHKTQPKPNKTIRKEVIANE